MSSHAVVSSMKLHGSASQRTSHAGAWLTVALLLAVVGYIDYGTGYDVSVFVLYALPVAVATHHFGLLGGVLIALLAGLEWGALDVLAGHVYARAWVLYINAANRTFFFMVCALAFDIYRHGSAHALAQHMVIECRQCQRVKVGRGDWVTNGSYIDRQDDTPIKLRYQKICPDCARRVYAKAGYRNQHHPT